MTLEDIAAAEAELSLWYQRHAMELSCLPFGEVNWTYDGDAHVKATTPLKTIVMGINPGDGNGAKTSGISPSERTWRTRCVKLTGRSPSEIEFSELVSIPTKKIATLKDASFTIETALEASRRTNEAIIAFHKPKVIYQPGFLTGYLTSVPNLYNLKEKDRRPRANGKGTLLTAYETPGGIPWFRHFAAFGFSKRDMEDIQTYVSELGH
ncbi:MAG: hypothetical protein WDN06_06805 [Asticcacaulis sp.]